MVNIVMDGICKGCTQADLELIFTEDLFNGKSWSVYCRHQYACENIKRRITEQLKGEDNKHDS